MKITNHTRLRIAVLFNCIFLCGALYAQGVIQHKEGEYYEGLLPNGMQKTHTYNSVIYVNPTAGTQTRTITLPSTSNASPHFYFRWFDYETDGIPSQVTPKGTTYTNGYVEYGGGVNLQSVSYTISAGALPDFLACDVSANTDYTVVNGVLTVEPTLSYRTIFEIRDAHEIADALRDKTAAGEYLQDKIVYMPATPASSHQKPRVTLDYDQSSYHGYDGNGNLYAPSLTFSGSNYDSNSGRFIFVNPGAAGTSTQIIVTQTVGSSPNQRTYNVARFTIYFIEDAPAPYTDTGYRSLNYLDENYVLLSQLDFDYDTDLATAANNMWHQPLEPDNCEYGFVSEVLFNEGKRGMSGKVAQWSEYGFYKTANVSIPGLSGYTWYNQGRQVYDRLYYTSEGRHQGYFMYIDAAQTPGIVAKLPINQLCGGTKLIVSAGICSLTQSGVTSYPDLNFVFMGVDAAGNYTELNRYTSGDIPIPESNPWHQIYYSFTYDSNVDYVSYVLQIENNCTSTAGGDYAVDDIRVYRSKPAVQAYQLNLGCGEEEIKVKMRVEFDKLLASVGKTEQTSGAGETFTLKFKFLDENLNPIAYEYGTASNPNTEYGQISVSTNFSDMTALTSGVDPPVADGDLSKYTYTEEEVLDGINYRYVSFLAPNPTYLEINKVYYLVIANEQDTFDTGLCALLSDPFSLIPFYAFTMDGDPWIEGDGLCYGNPITVGITLRQAQHPTVEIPALFDWYLGTVEEFQAINDSLGYSLQYALSAYRSVYPNPNQGDALSTTYQGVYTQEIHDFLQAGIDAGLLVLNEPEITKVIRQGDIIVAVPLLETAQLPAGIDIADLCDSMIIVIASGPAQNPTLEVGNINFESLRMGLPQFDDLNNNPSKTVTLPVSDFMNSDGTKSRPLTLATDSKLYVVESDDTTISLDPKEPTTFIELGEVTAINVSGTSADNVVFNIPGNTPLIPREGYTYTIEFHFNEEAGNGGLVTCDGTAIFRIKIVPEYLTWTGDEGDNWNNDTNWRRSVGTEIYKNDYTDDLDSHGFVPMYFCKVTIPQTDQAQVVNSPWLYPLSGTPFLNMDNTNYTSVADKTANAATEDIEYDLVLTPDGSNYAGVNFYGNTTGEIYFKPLAEMRGTNYLTYDKAHVEFELTPERWYMLASPLQGTVAGDMYLPTATARQETEAFVPIVFDPAVNNRFDPAVYQRSWDESNSIVFRKDGTTEDAYISAEWSQVYNKVDEAYTPGKGFSIKTVVNDTGKDKVLFRLPKDDTEFLYYSYDGSVTGNNTFINRTANGRLAFESPLTDITVNLSNQTSGNPVFLVGNPFIASLDMNKFFDINTDFERRYWLITENGLGAVQLQADGSVINTGDDMLNASVSPMQAFFLERTDGSNGTAVTFTPDMTIFSDNLILRARNRVNQDTEIPTLRIKATRNQHTSHVLIQQEPDAINEYDSEEDMRVIMDSNLADIPTLYTMAGKQATVINRVNSLDNIPLGIFSNDESEVVVTFEGVENFGTELYIYDNLEENTYVITADDNSITLPGSTHGRYSIHVTGVSNSAIPDSAIRIYSSDKGKVTVNTGDADRLDYVKVYGVDGILIKEFRGINDTFLSFDLISGQTYIVVASGLHGVLREKVHCY